MAADFGFSAIGLCCSPRESRDLAQLLQESSTAPPSELSSRDPCRRLSSQELAVKKMRRPVSHHQRLAAATGAIAHSSPQLPCPRHCRLDQIYARVSTGSLHGHISLQPSQDLVAAPEHAARRRRTGRSSSRASFFRCRIVDWHSLSWKNRAGKLSPALVLTTTLPNHHPKLGGRTNNEYISLTGTANAYVPAAFPCEVVLGGGGTRYDCFGGEEESDRSTLTYVSYASPSADSGIQARRSEEA